MKAALLVLFCSALALAGQFESRPSDGARLPNVAVSQSGLSQADAPAPWTLADLNLGTAEIGVAPYPAFADQVQRAEAEVGPAALPTAEGLRDYLGAMKLVRIAVPSAPGNGHQAVGASIAKRLRELGFQGKLQFIFDGDIKEKLDLTLPGFDPKGPNRQRLPDLGGEAISKKNFLRSPARLRKADLGISAADSELEYALRGRAHINVEPYHWGSAHVRVKGLYGDGNGLRPYVISVTAPNPGNPGAFIAEKMSHTPRLAEKVAGLQELAQGLGKHELLPAYGLSGNSGRVSALLNAVLLAQDARPEAFRGGVIVPLFSHLSDALIEEVAQRRRERDQGRLKIVSVRHADEVRRAIAGLKAGEVLLVRVGGVAQDVFEYFYSRQTLPGTVAGVNGQNMMRSFGLPYLTTTDNSSLTTADVEALMSSQVRDLATSASSEIDVGRAYSNVTAAYLLLAKDPDSEIARAHREARPVELRHDKVAMLLSMAQRQQREGYLGALRRWFWGFFR